MKSLKLTVATVVACLALGGCSGASAGADPAAASHSDHSPSVEPQVVNPLGLGESLVLVVGGVYPTKAEARAAVEASSGELQGYYLAPTDDFDVVGTSDYLTGGQWLAASAFRTRAGADEFVTSMNGTQVGPPAMVVQVRRTGGTADIGLGQEANPDGSGPLVSPLPDQEKLQE